MVKGSLKEKALQRKLEKEKAFIAENHPYQKDPSVASRKLGDSIPEHIETPDFEYAKASIENGAEVSQFTQNNF